MHDHNVNGIGKPKKPGPTLYNCTRGINRGRNRVSPEGKPDMTRTSAWSIPPSKVRAGLETANSNDDQLTMKIFGITKVGVEVIR